MNFVAIDGTEYSKPMFDMIIAGAYSCEGNMIFSQEEGGKISIIYNDKFIGHTRDISSCLPIYINEIPQVDHTYHRPNLVSKSQLYNLYDSLRTSASFEKLARFISQYLQWFCDVHCIDLVGLI